MRPYSLITYMGHRITFKLTGEIISIRRTKLNNLIPSNLPQIVLTKTAGELPTIQQAQNRRIYAETMGADEGTGTYSWYHM